MSTAVKLQTQIATGKKFTTPSENVAVGQQLAEFDRKNIDAAAYNSNMNMSASLLSQADTTLDSIVTQMQRATELTVRAGNGTLSVADRKVIGDELKAVVDTLVGLGNVPDSNGRSLFGSAAGTPAVTKNTDGTFTYNTAPSLSEVPIADNMSIQPTETAARIFQSPAGDTLAVLTQLAAALQAGDPTGESARGALDKVNTATDQVSIVQSSIGARAARVDLQQTLQENVSADREELRSSLEDTDLTSAAAEFAKTMTILNATQSSFSKLSQLSLFSYLR
ncbi:flagellin N-terminal helical domain-containing protein [Sphingomonas sp. Leaf231]|uniref:flagellin N-terminal helical domain-containing protein n=1 Tax=Sphingomonas sp. Leaf231 TaxID=1736301 RepID=UPI00138EE22B|nr:flagellin [Sphingomonas sp. Leaf231]